MSQVSKAAECEAFAQRFRAALKVLGVRPSPVVVANEFNLRYWGKSISPNTARNWLLGKALPTQDKLRVLATWLNVGVHELRFGADTATDSACSAFSLELADPDRQMLQRYLALPTADQKTIRDVVTAFTLAMWVSRQKISPSDGQPLNSPTGNARAGVA
jgi:transcriptional regulator with XRE-family HTH domain